MESLENPIDIPRHKLSSRFRDWFREQSTEVESPENLIYTSIREAALKFHNWPTEQEIGQIKNRAFTGTSLLEAGSRWSDEESQLPGYEELVAFADSWVENLISHIRLTRKINHAKRISTRLNDLRSMVLEETGENEDLSKESVRSFFSFLKMHPNVRYPDITLTPDGNIYSRWKGNNGALLGIEFLPDFKVAYVVFVPAPSHAGEVTRHSGIDFTDTVFKKINAAFSVAEWIFE